MKKKRIFDFKREYKEIWNYLKESRIFIYFAIGIFLVSFILAFFIPLPEILLNYILNFIQELLEKTSGMSSFEIISFIFFNNLSSSFFGMIFGAFFGIFSFIALIANGFVLGFVSSLSVAESGFFSLWRILPHGIFELPAIFLALGFGLKLGGKLIERLFQIKGKFNQFLVILLGGFLISISLFLIYLLIGNFVIIPLFFLFLSTFYYFIKEEKLRAEIILAFKVFLLIIIPLLIFAGIIEGTLISLFAN